MCNAHNHPPGCNCGWGGGWYGNGNFPDTSSWQFNKDRPRKKEFLGLQGGTTTSLSGGYVNSNSKCPVCGASVYYYESAKGGRVFFDSLGPPWPKHPCTSNNRQNIDTSAKKSYIPWHHDNWKYLINVTINPYSTIPDIYSLSGICTKKKYQFYFLSSEIVLAEIVRYRKNPSGYFEISILDFDIAKEEWAIWEGSVFTELKQAQQGAELKRTPLHSHSKTGTQIREINNLIKCPKCNAMLKRSRLESHLIDTHNI